MSEDRTQYRLPGAILPRLELEAECYASLRMRLDLYQDMIMATRYEEGRPGPTFAVDPGDLAAALGGLSLNSGLLPANCLFWGRADGQERLGIYVAPGVWGVQVTGEAETWQVPLPGFVFTGQGQKYGLYAVKDRPTRADIPLFHFPAPNVGQGICAGSAPFPVAGAATIWEATHVFFQSRFNKHLANGKSLMYPANILEMWRALHQGEADVYPVADLVETGWTLGAVL